MEILFLPVAAIPAVIFAGLGLLIKYKKAYWLIAGYNTMSEENKKKVDVKNLGSFIANILFVLAAIILVAGTMLIQKQIVFAGIAFALIVPVTIYTLIGAQKFDGNTRNSGGTMTMKTRVTLILTIALLVVITGGVIVLLNASSKPAGYTLESEVLKISGMYGKEIPLEKISKLQLKSTMPEITYKSNGSGLGTMYKGHFELEEIEKAMLFVDTSRPPYVYFEYDGESYFINCASSAETEELHKLLEAGLSGK